MKLPILKGLQKFVITLMATTSVATILVGSPTAVFAQGNTPIHLAMGYAKGHGSFNIVVQDNPGTKLKLYVNDAHPVSATTNSHSWATFVGVKLSGTGKLSFTQILNGNHGSYQRPINYTQRYIVTSGKVAFAIYAKAAVVATPEITTTQAVATPAPTPAPSPAVQSNPTFVSTSQPVTVSTPASVRTPTCTNGTYVNSSGNTVCSPETAVRAPAGATAQCNDGTYSFSQHHSGTCSGHAGVASWL